MITSADIKNLIIPIITTGSLSITDLVTKIANLFALVGGILAFFFLVYAGFLYITAGNNPDQAKKALQGLINVIIGIVVIALSYVLIRFVGNTIVNIVK